jgi:hypothetical protein
MTTTTAQRRIACNSLILCACAMLPMMSSWSMVNDSLSGRSQLAQARQCEQRHGPFVTQDTAWRHWREARDRGLAVSRGVAPCYDQYTRGYCFVEYRAC